MSDDLQNKLVHQLGTELDSYGINCSDEQLILLIRHLLLVIEKNKVMNLTRIVDPSEAVSLHIVDSLLPLAGEGLSCSEKQSFLDIGTGAGFPGLPLSIVTGMGGLLVDSVGKKVGAVNEFIDALSLRHVVATHARIEELPLASSRRYDFAFARAVAQSNVLIEYATPLLKAHGRLVLEKARPSDDELSHARSAADICGLELVSRETYELPRELGHREILVYEKARKSKIRLPRRTGLAKSDPLG